MDTVLRNRAPTGTGTVHETHWPTQGQSKTKSPRQRGARDRQEASTCPHAQGNGSRQGERKHQQSSDGSGEGARQGRRRNGTGQQHKHPLTNRRQHAYSVPAAGTHSAQRHPHTNCRTRPAIQTRTWRKRDRATKTGTHTSDKSNPQARGRGTNLGLGEEAGRRS